MFFFSGSGVSSDLDMEASLFRQLSGAREPVGIEGLANGKGGGGNGQLVCIRGALPIGKCDEMCQRCRRGVQGRGGEAAIA